MSTYTPGPSNAKDLNKKLKEYREVERLIDEAILEKRQELARIEAAKHKLKARATYEPTPEAINYRDANWFTIARQPRPLHGGPAGLRRAALEAAQWDQAHRRGNAA